MPHIYIGNLRNKHSYVGTKEIRIDRVSPVGNPFYMRSEDLRDTVCDQYESFFYHTLINEPLAQAYLAAMVETLNSGQDITLMCWCAPKRCHGLTIKKYLETQGEFK